MQIHRQMAIELNRPSSVTNVRDPRLQTCAVELRALLLAVPIGWGIGATIDTLIRKTSTP
jgi:hypothetical protein